MNYVNYVENNNFYFVLPDYVEHNKENINLSNINFECSQFFQTNQIKQGENQHGVNKNMQNCLSSHTNLNMNNRTNHAGNIDLKTNRQEQNFHNSNNLIDIVHNKYLENQIQIKNIIHGNNSGISTAIPNTNVDFNLNTNEAPENISQTNYLNYPFKDNIYRDENQVNLNPDLMNSNISLGHHSAFQSTDDNISMNNLSRNLDSIRQNNIQNSNCAGNLLIKNKRHLTSIYDKYFVQIPHDFLLDIWESFKYDEQIYSIGPDFMKIQKDINEKMRAILIDWLVEVHQRFNLTPETLFLAINIIDRYISYREILRTQLQLVGVASLFIACKYEEILCPDIRDFVYITDKTYSKSEILKMERDILTALNFDITVPTSFRMFEIIALNFNFNEIEFAYGSFLLESFLIDPKYHKYNPSIISCAIAYIIMKMNNYANYQDVYKIITSNQKTLKDCAKEIFYFSSNLENMQYKAVYKKYSAKEFFCVSINGMGLIEEYGAR